MGLDKYRCGKVIKVKIILKRYYKEIKYIILNKPI